MENNTDMQDEGREQSALLAIEEALRNAGMLAFSGEVQLLDWSKSTSREPPKIKFAMLDDSCLTAFESATTRKGKQAGQIYHVFAIPVSDDAAINAQESVSLPEKPSRTPNQLAKQLHQSGYFRRVSTWDRMHQHGVYTLSTHKAHVASQPCFFCNKPASQAVQIGATPWMVVSACDEHKDAIATSPSNILGLARTNALASVEGGVKSGMKLALGIESLAELTPGMLADFRQMIGDE